MRPVNLLPSEIRRRGAAVAGDRRSYYILGALAVVLVGILAVVLTNNTISDNKAKVARLEQQQIDVKAQADAVQSFATFRNMEEQRTATVTSLAESRFDWERVLRELSVVIPSDVWLINVTGTAVPGVEIDNGADLSARTSVTGPALEIVGCAPSQDAVAGFVSALENIDGVTRVGVQSAGKPQQQTGGTGSGSSTGSGDCRTRDSISKFELVVAFDAAPVPNVSAGATPPAQSAAPAPSSGDGGVGQAQQEQAAANQSSQQQTDKAKQAVNNYVPGQ